MNSYQVGGPTVAGTVGHVLAGLFFPFAAAVAALPQSASTTVYKWSGCGCYENSPGCKQKWKFTIPKSTGKFITFDTTYIEICYTIGNIVECNDAKITLAKNNIWHEDDKEGTLIHELFHALGAQHEHQRYDLNNFDIMLNFERIKQNNVNDPDTIYQYNMMQGDNLRPLTVYDPWSIMHYDMNVCMFVLLCIHVYICIYLICAFVVDCH